MSLAAAIASSSVGERPDRRDRAEDLLVAAAARRPGRRRGRSARRSSPARRPPCRRVTQRRALARRRPRTSSATLPRWSSSISGPTSTPSSVPRPTLQRAHPLGELRRELLGDATRGRGSGWPRVHASPMLRILAIIAPSTAASRSASSKTRNGALPPSSIETRRTCSAACAISFCPTSVEPVKDSLRVRGSSISGSIDRAADSAGDDVEHAAGQPGLLEDLREREHRQRRLLGGLDDHRAARGDRRADLARAHRHREVPRRDEQARADGLPHRQHAARAVLVAASSGPSMRTASSAYQRRKFAA